MSTQHDQYRTIVARVLWLYALSFCTYLIRDVIGHEGSMVPVPRNVDGVQLLRMWRRFRLKETPL